MTGRPYGIRPTPGIDLFVDDEGATTVAAAVAILVSLALVFGMATTQWVVSRSADVQAIADAAALAGMNVVAEYVTVAQVIDAVVLSMGLIGMVTIAIGTLLSAIPLINSVGPPIISAAMTLFEARYKFAESSAHGLEMLEKAVPYLVMANSSLTVNANKTRTEMFVGVALPYPMEGASNFGVLSADTVLDTVKDAEKKGEEIDALTAQAAEAETRADEALERGWRADCGDDPSMRERAQTLAALMGAQNPNYHSIAGWTFEVPILRARTYYEKRLAQEAPENNSTEERTRSAARTVFYRYAVEQLEMSSYVEHADGTVTCDLKSLTSNTSDVRETHMYTDEIWPCTQEEAGRTIHAYAACPGATGPASGAASVKDEEDGIVVRCKECNFYVVTLGRTPAASSVIDNGFEYYWRQIVDASKDYEANKNEQIRCEQEAQEASESVISLFQAALEGLGVTRVTLAPPGRYGCIAVVSDPLSRNAPSTLVNSVNAGGKMSARIAISAATLAPDNATKGNTILAGFFDGLIAQGGVIGGVSTVLDAVMSAWGDFLVGYENTYNAFVGFLDDSIRTLRSWGFGGIANWLSAAFKDITNLVGLQPADLTAKKPVLTNTSDVMMAAGMEWYGTIQELIQIIQVAAPGGPQAVHESLGLMTDFVAPSGKLKIADFTIPGTDISIPLEVDLSWAGIGNAA